jgi:hypothetical protein
MIYNVNDLLDLPSNAKDVIKRHLTEYEIYSYYLGFAFQVGKNINSPFRKDPSPSFNIGYNSTADSLFYFDHGDASYSGDCFKFVAQLHSVTYQEAFYKIYKDLITGKIKNPNSPVIIKYDGRKAIPKKILQFEPRDFTKADRDYWNNLGITQEFRDFFKIKAAQTVYLDLNLIWTSTPEDPIYIYKIFNKIKVYRPLSKDKSNKWMSNCTMYDVQGWEQLPEMNDCDTLIITKSLKDVAVLRSLGYLAISPSSENTMIPPAAMELLKTKFGFKRFIVLYDRDHGGMVGARKMFIRYRGEFNIAFKFIGRGFPKDVASMVHFYGARSTKRYLLTLLQHVPTEKYAKLFADAA